MIPARPAACRRAPVNPAGLDNSSNKRQVPATTVMHRRRGTRSTGHQVELAQLEAEWNMPYVTSVERMGIEKGLQQGEALC